MELRNGIPEDCFFLRGNGSCKILIGYCKGKCSFYKTTRQFIDDENRAIMLNRRKGNCKKCKYYAYPCNMTGEKIPNGTLCHEESEDDI